MNALQDLLEPLEGVRDELQKADASSPFIGNALGAVNAALDNVRHELQRLAPRPVAAPKTVKLPPREQRNLTRPTHDE